MSNNYNRSGPGHPSMPRETDNPVAIALREAISIMDEAYFASLANPLYRPLYEEYKEFVMTLARLI